MGHACQAKKKPLISFAQLYKPYASLFWLQSQLTLTLLHTKLIPPRYCDRTRSKSHSSFHSSRLYSLVLPTLTGKMASNQSSWDSTRDSAAQKADETKNYGAEKAGQAQEHAQGMGEATKQKASETGSAAQQKMDEAKRGTSDASQTAMEKATQAKDSAASTLQQAGNKVTETFNSAKDAITGNK